LSSKFDGIWIHVDMASPVTDGDRGTGYGVALLNTLFAHSLKNDLMKSLAYSNEELPLKNELDSSANDD
jgi:hypothetical protein